MRGRAGLASAAVVAGLTLGGCGSSGPAREKGNGEAAKPPLTILADAGAALRKAGSYDLRTTLVQGANRIMIAGRIAGPRSLEVTIAQSGAELGIIELPGRFYFRANAAFWRFHDPGRAGSLAGRWISVPAALAAGALAPVDVLTPANLSRCLLEDDGRLRVTGRASVDGRAAVVVTDAGGVPGGSAGKAVVAAAGPPYLLRLTATGPTLPGGRVDVCNDGRGGDVIGAVTLSRFGAVAPIEAPPVAGAGGPSV